MSNIAQKRILKDITELSKNPLHDHGIFTYSDESNFNILYVLMIGPTETPYEDGFFFFTIHFPEKTYPNEPPSVKFYPMNYKTRFNPNLYKCGKVCLSIINTWQGPGWTACNTISSVLLSIQAMVLNNEPLRNEPGYTESKNIHTIKSYSLIIEHETCKIAILQNLKKLPKEFEIFMSIIEKHFMKYFIRILSKIQKYIETPPSTLNYGQNSLNSWIWGTSNICNVYHFEFVPNYPQIKSDLENYYFDVLTPKFEKLEKDGKNETDEMGNPLIDKDLKTIFEKNENYFQQLLEKKKEDEMKNTTEKKRLINPHFLKKKEEINEEKMNQSLEKIQNSDYSKFFEECAKTDEQKKKFADLIDKFIDLEKENVSNDHYVSHFLKSFKLMTYLSRYQQFMNDNENGKKYIEEFLTTFSNKSLKNTKKTEKVQEDHQTIDEKTKDIKNTAIKTKKIVLKKNKNSDLLADDNENDDKIIIKPKTSTNLKETHTQETHTQETYTQETYTPPSINLKDILPPYIIKGFKKDPLVKECLKLGIEITYMGPISKTNPILKEKPKTIDMLFKEYSDVYESLKK